MSSSSSTQQSVPVKKAPRPSLLRACERCRRRKIRCDEFFPCASCTRLGVPCKVPDTEKRAERTQSVLEERVKRLESLLAASNGMQPSPSQEQADISRCCSPAPGGSPGLRLQIPASQGMGPTEDELFSATSFEYLHSPDYDSVPQTPNGNMQGLPDGSTWPFNFNALELEPGALRRTHSLPFSLGESSTPHMSIPPPTFNFPDISGDNDLQSPDIPVIEVTSWDTTSNCSSIPAGQGLFVMPELSIGSWSGPPSPSLTAASQHDMHFSDSDFTIGHSRRSSMALSERSYEGIGSLKPTTQSRPRSRSDILPHGSKLQSTSGAWVQSQMLHNSQTVQPNQAGNFHFDESIFQNQLKIETDELLYARTYFEHVNPFFPVVDQETIKTLVEACRDGTDLQQPSPGTASLSLIIAIGAHLQAAMGTCDLAASRKYYAIAEGYLPPPNWSTSTSLASIQSNTLLALYTIISSSNTSAGGTGPNLWLLNAHIAASCIDLGLHQHCLKFKEPFFETFYSAYVLDRTIGRLQGRPSCFHDGDVGNDVLFRTQDEIQHRKKAVLNGEGSSLGQALLWYRS